MSLHCTASGTTEKGQLLEKAKWELEAAAMMACKREGGNKKASWTPVPSLSPLLQWWKSKNIQGSEENPYISLGFWNPLIPN